MSFRSERTRLRSGPGLAIALALCAVVAPAQAEPQAGSQSNPGAGVDESLEAKDRTTLHPSVNPTAVVGLEQGDNSFRHRTPGLSQGNLTPAMVDLDESRKRRLAMYEGSTFTHPVLPAASSGFGTGNGAAYSEPSEVLDVAGAPDGEHGAVPSYWRVAPFCLFVMALAAFVLRRSQARRSSTA